MLFMPGLRPIGAEHLGRVPAGLIVPSLLLGVGQAGVGRGDLFEGLLRLWGPVFVRVALQGELFNS